MKYLKSKTDINATISKNIKQYRKMNKMTQAQLAEKLCLDTQYYAQLERGERSFTIEKIILACDIFQVGIDRIITFKDSSEDNSNMLHVVNRQLKHLSNNQLRMVEKFIEDIIPYMD